MSKLRSVIGSKDFKQRVTDKLKEVDRNINNEDLYFSQTTTGYYMDYKPNYPEKSNCDFVVYQNINGLIFIYGNLNANIPTIIRYENIEDFEDSYKLNT